MVQFCGSSMWLCELITHYKMISSIGLIFDVVGASLIFVYGIPDKIDREGHTHIITTDINKAEIEKAKRYDLCSRAGSFLLILGFLLQLSGNCF